MELWKENKAQAGVRAALISYLLLYGRGDDGNFSLRHRNQTGSTAHAASYPIGLRALSPG
jgi:hypothetical protein